MKRAGLVAMRGAIRCLCSLFVLCTTAPSAFGQAWVPPARIGDVSFVYQNIDNTGHLLADGSELKGFDSASQGWFLNFDYAVTDRFSFSVGVPYIASKYIGPEPSLFGLPIDDCICWNHGWQDFGGTLRYNLVNDVFALTPSVSIGVPTHHYDYFGEAVVGRNLKELRIVVDAGRRLDEISERLSVSGSYSYAFVEKVINVPNNRSNFAIETGVLITRMLSGRVGLLWQHSHGGLHSTDFVTDEQIEQFDRLVKDNNFHIAGGLSRSFQRFDVFGSYTHYMSGTDTHQGHAISAGLSWPFER